MSLQDRLAALISAIGTDVKALKSAVASSRAWYEEIRTTVYTNTTVNGTSIFVGFTPEANSIYLIEAELVQGSSLSTSGPQYAVLGPASGITRAALKILTPPDWLSDRVDNLSALNTYTAATAGLSPELVHIWGIIEVGASPGAGNITIAGRSEVGTNTTSVWQGSIFRWRKV